MLFGSSRGCSRCRLVDRQSGTLWPTAFDGQAACPHYGSRLSMKPSNGIALLVCLSLIGCQGLNLRPSKFQFPRLPEWKSKLRSQSPDKQDNEFETTIQVPMVGDYTTVAGLNLINLQGIGLVTRLDGTGSDPPPSSFRTRLLAEMRRHGVTNPNEVLRSPSTALVVIQAYLPPLVRRGDQFDIEVRVPGVDKTTSLNGGWLMATELSEHAVVPGRGPLKGHIYAKAKGPILISTGEGDRGLKAGVLRRGRVLGGGISTKDRNLALYLRNDFRSVRNSKRIADRIGTRFSDYDRYGLKRPLAEAKTDQKIELIVPLRYKDNYPRYLEVIRSIAFRETDVAQRVRMQKLKQQLIVPEMSERASLRLEAIGLPAVPILRTGLNSSSLEVRFQAAMALTYLNESDGLKVLAETARVEPSFRVFALAAMAASDDAESNMLLRELLNERSAETRYGAWRALTTMERHDPLVHDQGISDEFQFHVLDTDGEPMIHLTNRKKAEIVLFGKDQRFHTPITVRAGTHVLVNAPQGSDTLIVSRHDVGSDQRKIVSARIADVIRAAAELGATYPDIAQMLSQADRQHNIPGGIQVDAVPQSGRTYYRPTDGNEPQSASGRKTRVGRAGLAPNLFASRRGKQNRNSSKSAQKFGESNPDAGVASHADVREDSSDDLNWTEDEPRKWYDFFRDWEWPLVGKQIEPVLEDE